MHAWRRRVCEVLTLLVFAHGAWLFCRNFGAQWVRLRWALHYVPAGPLPGADNIAVLSEAGLSAAQIEQLRAAGAFR